MSFSCATSSSVWPVSAVTVWLSPSPSTIVNVTEFSDEKKRADGRRATAASANCGCECADKTATRGAEAAEAVRIARRTRGTAERSITPITRMDLIRSVYGWSGILVGGTGNTN